MVRTKTILNWDSVLFLISGGALALIGWLHGGNQGLGSIEQGERLLPNGIVAAGYVLLLAGAVLLWLRVRIPSHIEDVHSQNTPA